MPTPIIDQATFSALRDTAGADFVNELATTFCEETPGLLAELRAAWGAKSAERFRRAAHSIGPSQCRGHGLFDHDVQAARRRLKR